MEAINVDMPGDWHASWLAERPRLVRLCARLSGDPDAADDLAQETLFEAWRHRAQLRDPEREAQWLSGIARNVTLRWLRTRGHEAAHLVGLLCPDAGDDANTPNWDDVLAGEADIAADLERTELANLLDEALALLPPETRSTLLAHYLNQTPLAELAGSLGATDAAVAMRLHRGRLALRRILTSEMGARFAAYAPDLYERHAWETTPLWCTTCGRHHLLGRYHVAEGELWLRCPECSPDPGLLDTHSGLASVMAGVRGYKRATERLRAWVHRYYTPHLPHRRIPCHNNCGPLITLTHERPDNIAPSPIGNDLGVRHVCPVCGSDCWHSLDGLALATAAGTTFRQRNPRIRTLPHQYVEAQGRAIVIARFESVTMADRLVVVADADTLEVLATEG